MSNQFTLLLFRAVHNAWARIISPAIFLYVWLKGPTTKEVKRTRTTITNGLQLLPFFGVNEPTNHFASPNKFISLTNCSIKWSHLGWSPASSSPPSSPLSSNSSSKIYDSPSSHFSDTHAIRQRTTFWKSSQCVLEVRPRDSYGEVNSVWGGKKRAWNFKFSGESLAS